MSHHKSKENETEVTGSFDVTGSDRAIAEALKGIEKLQSEKGSGDTTNETPDIAVETQPESEAKKNEAWREQLMSLLKQKDATIKDAHDRFLRQAAEFENYKKRMKKDQEIENERTVEHFVRELLPVIDSFERTLKHGQTVQNPSPDFVNLMDGINLIQRQVLSFLEKLKISPIETKDKMFDPAFHEAVSQIPTTDFPHMHIIEELEKGFTLGKRLLRAAKVVVALKPPQ